MFSVVLEDTCPMMAESVLISIFDKFYQADGSHKQEGNGLGLTLVKRVLTIEGGEIQAENRPLGGCCFTVTLRTK